jgi:hypothetical protein
MNRCGFLWARLFLIMTAALGWGAVNGALWAQDSFSFQAETVRLRAQIALPGTDARQKHDLLVELAELLRLSGDNAGAALAWHDAAYAIPAERDDRALLEEAACLMATGEWEGADSAVRLVLITSRNSPGLVIRAKYLFAQIEAFRRGNIEALRFLLDDPDYSALKASIYYTLFVITREAGYRERLIAEFPESPETRLLTDDATPFPGAMWLLYPGREGVVIQR